MTSLATSLLRSLIPAPTSGPVGPSAFAGLGGATTGQSFSSLLSAARGGALTSERPVEATPDVKGKLSADQLSRIAVAADQAEAAGMNSALVLIDGAAVQLDVLSREVTGVLDPRTAAVTGVDGVLAAPPSSIAAQVAGGRGAADPTSLPGVLEQRLLAKLGSRPAGLVAQSVLKSALGS
ncbi:MAG: hypothetical protein QM783_14970 [Phycisphaerales bacterium]